MPELVGLLACICMSAYVAGYVLRDIKEDLDDDLFCGLVSMLVGLAMLLLTASMFYGIIRLLAAAWLHLSA